MRKVGKKLRSIVIIPLLAMFCLVGMDLEVYAAEDMEDSTSLYDVIIEDDADLLTEGEEDSLASLMMDITAYGNVAFKTIDENDYTTERYISNYYEEVFGSSSGIVFMIDMDNRNIWIYCDGDIYDVITSSYADTITDNVYEYASYEEYYICAYEAFSQALTLLEGNKIAQPMKYISNAVLALVLALMINYFVVRAMSRSVKPGKKELLDSTRHKYELANAETEFVNTTRTYSPRSSGGGSSGGGGGRSGGGGGRSGGGGGHRF